MFERETLASRDGAPRQPVGQLPGPAGRGAAAARTPSARRAPGRAGCGGSSTPASRSRQASICEARPFVSSDPPEKPESRGICSAGGSRLSHAAQVRLRRMADAHETTQARLEWLRELRDEALHAGSEGARGRRAGARKDGYSRASVAEKLCDEGLVRRARTGTSRHRESNFGMMDRRPYGDAVVTGYGDDLRAQGLRPSRRTSPSSAARSARCFAREDLQG